MNTAKPSIIQITGYYPPHLGGMEKVAEEISKELARKHYPVTVFTSTIGDPGNGRDRTETTDNYEIKRLLTTEVAHTPILWPLFFRLLAAPKNSIFHVHISQAGIPETAIIAAKLKGIPFIAHFHLDVGPSGSMGSLLPLYKKYFLGPVLRAANKVIVFSDEQSAEVKKLYRVDPAKIAIVPNGVGGTFFYDGPRPIPKAAIQLLYVGRLEAQKRVERLIEMMRVLTIPAHLTIVGSGSEQSKLTALVDKYHLDTVSFVGQKHGDELRELYKKADVFLIASDIEGMPLAVLEAMASGLPIVGTDVAGTRELIKDVGILIGPPYAENFAAAIEGMWEKKYLLASMGRASFEKAKRYSWKTLIAQMETIYQETLA